MSKDAERELEGLFWPAPKRAHAKEPTGMKAALLLLTSSGANRAREARHNGAVAPGTLLRAELRAHLRRAPQVLVKITGGSRGMAGITAHIKYITHDGERELEDQDGNKYRGEAALDDLRQEWRDAGATLPWTGERKEAHHVLFQMPAGTDPNTVLDAVRAFARSEFDGHRYAMALHQHQSTPHVHVIVRTESDDGYRLNPRKADLHRWRMRFAHELRERGVEAAASRQRTRGYAQRHEHLWEKKLSAREQALRERALRARTFGRSVEADDLEARAEAVRRAPATRVRARGGDTDRQIAQARTRWDGVRTALAASSDADDRQLADETARFIRTEFDRAPTGLEHERHERHGHPDHENSRTR